MEDSFVGKYEIMSKLIAEKKMCKEVMMCKAHAFGVALAKKLDCPDKMIVHDILLNVSEGLWYTVNHTPDKPVSGICKFEENDVKKHEEAAVALVISVRANPYHMTVANKEAFLTGYHIGATIQQFDGMTELMSYATYVKRILQGFEHADMCCDKEETKEETKEEE